MKYPEISIIIPFYNSQDYIERCINSVLKQKFLDFELILIDDGSTDRSFQIALRFAKLDDRIILLQKENGGQGSARNLGLEHARGSFIGFVDSDDFIDPQMYKILHEHIISNSADLAVCGYNTFRKINGTPKPLTRIQEVILFDNFTLMKTYLSDTYISGGPCNKLYSKKLFDNVRFPILKMREDAYVMPHIIKNTSKAVYVGKNLYNWFLREGSTERSSFSINNLSALDSIKSLESVVKKHYLSLIGYVKLEYASTIVYLLSKIITSGSFIKNKKTYKDLLDELFINIEKIGEYKYIDPKRYNYIKFAATRNNLFIVYEYMIYKLKAIIKRLFFS